MITRSKIIIVQPARKPVRSCTSSPMMLMPPMLERCRNRISTPTPASRLPASVPYQGSICTIGNRAACTGAHAETSTIEMTVRIVKLHPRRHTASSANGTLMRMNRAQNGQPVA